MASVMASMSMVTLQWSASSTCKTCNAAAQCTVRGTVSAFQACCSSSAHQICGPAQAFGEDVAILAGDALLTLAFEYICRETRGVAPERIVRVCFHAEPQAPPYMSS